MEKIRIRLPKTTTENRKNTIKPAGKVIVIKKQDIPEQRKATPLPKHWRETIEGSPIKNSKKSKSANRYSSSGKIETKKLDKLSEVNASGYILLDCFTNLDSVGKLYRDSCDIPLKEQFQELKKKFPLLHDDFSSFIEETIPKIQWNYKLTKIGPVNASNSSFLKVMVTGRFIDIPEPYKLILIGDVSTAQFPYSIVATRIELFDEKLIPQEYACLEKVFLIDVSTRGKKKGSPFFHKHNGKNLIADQGFMNQLKDSYILDPARARRLSDTLNSWHAYLNFRDEYLDKLKGQVYSIYDKADIVNVFSISQKEYQRNKYALEVSLLVPQISPADKKIYITRDASSSVQETLIHVSVYKDLPVDDEDNKSFERKLRGVTSSSAILLRRQDSITTNVQDDLIFTLGDRVIFYKEVVDEAKNAFDNAFAKRKHLILKEVNNSYNALKNNEIEELVKNASESIRNREEQRLSELKSIFDLKCAEEIKNNSDPSIRKSISEGATEYRNKKIEKLDQKIERARESIKKHKGNPSKYKTAQGTLDRLLKEKEEFEARPEYSEEEIIKAYKKKYDELYNAELIKSNTEFNEEISKLKLSKRRELDDYYQPIVEEEINSRINEAEQAEKERFSNMTDKSKYVIYHMYFELPDIDDLEYMLNALYKGSFHYISHDFRSDEQRLQRERNALSSFMTGTLKNPFILRYLFAPRLNIIKDKKTESDINWYQTNLNDEQKEAVKKSMASTGLFLLQGPPGTGKTQVISEIVYQALIRGQKVVISSETHKAIETVLERLPKTSEIRPLRLISDSNSKSDTNEFGPANFPEMLARDIVNDLDYVFATKFDSTKQISTLRSDIQKLKKSIDTYINKCSNAVLELQNLESLISQKNQISNVLFPYVNEKADIEKRLSDIKNMIDDFARNQYDTHYELDFYYSFKQQADDIFSGFKTYQPIHLEKLRYFCEISTTSIKNDTFRILSNREALGIYKNLFTAKKLQNSFFNRDTNEWPDETDSSYKDYAEATAEVKKLNEEINQIDPSHRFDPFRTGLIALFGKIADLFEPEFLNNFISYYDEAKVKILDLVSHTAEKLESEYKNLQLQESEYSNKIEDRRIKIRETEQAINNIKNNPSIEEIANSKTQIDEEISRLYKAIKQNVPNTDFNVAVAGLEKYCDDIEKAAYQTNIDYAEIERFKDDIKEYFETSSSAEEYALIKDAMNYANLIALTCTSRDYFGSDQLEILRKCGVGQSDGYQLASFYPDLLIIDEVSKCALIDLLIPMALYGTSIILAGDHRQLPPVYDLKHLKKSEFDDLEITGWDLRKNEAFTKEYERCFFKSLFESVDSSCKTMLTKQYRCHEDIMNVFNVFYQDYSGGGLRLGHPELNLRKTHNLTVTQGNVDIISPDKHIYFFDCKKYETSPDSSKGETSIKNEQEADVVVKLLEDLNSALESQAPHDSPLSVGVICTYGAQAGLIKKKLRNIRFENFATSSEEKLTISTVDDFQGDERDIMIVSMVRNPRPNRRFNLEFLSQYQRLNVAFSRARRMLIITGSRDFLMKYGYIVLDETTQNQEPVFRRILTLIDTKGRSIDAAEYLKGGSL